MMLFSWAKFSFFVASSCQKLGRNWTSLLGTIYLLYIARHMARCGNSSLHGAICGEAWQFIITWSNMWQGVAIHHYMEQYVTRCGNSSSLFQFGPKLVRFPVVQETGYRVTSLVPYKIFVNNENTFWHQHYPRQNALFKKLYYNWKCFEVNYNQYNALK